MSRASKALVVMMMGLMGLWGCAQGPASGPTAERIRSLESKCAKMEDDYKAVVDARDSVKKKLTTVEVEKKRLQEDLNEQIRLAKERTNERDGLQSQYDQFRSNIRNLLGQAEASLNSPSTPMSVIAENR